MTDYSVTEAKRTTAPELAFTLGGVIVRTEEDVRIVRLRAVRESLEWLKPQCDSVILQFRAALAKAGV